MSNDGHSKIKILFVIHDLSVGGAEKVLINLVNNMDYLKFDVTVLALFDEGVNKQFLNSTAQNKHQFRSIIYMIIAILNVVTTYIAVPYCGILGAATCSCFAYILGQGIVMNIYYYKVTGLDIPLFWKNILKMAIVPGIMMFSGLLINRIYEIDNWIIFLIGIIVFTGIYIVLMYEVSFNEYERSIFREPLKRIIKRIKG